ncbi:hypothetical protein BC938DRAFT_483935 [Jimgerdemannia flammicorona]|uniref:Yeast cell wall synthesis Kre9/Knh1-like N-terminal domain-containing protein n=1 Tax=Jimgerdemannia flammicorona TaxID=994334 RepID=A0A433QB16_9FUNG|nr:hypothetical protein BC938DRAFT_483935 [Jimgerdemannia flammicorona]
MVNFASIVASLALATAVSATLSPTDPGPTTVWSPGKQYPILWIDDNVAPLVTAAWKKMTIDFMTGDNLNQVQLTTVATGVDASKVSSYTWTCPTVSPPSQIYFFRFSAGDGTNFAWTTRFTITGIDGVSTVPPPNTTQPDGQKIGWGIGAISNSVAPSGSVASSATASGSVAVASSTAASSAPASGPTPANATSGSAANAIDSASTPNTIPTVAVKPNSAGRVAIGVSSFVCAVVLAMLMV